MPVGEKRREIGIDALRRCPFVAGQAGPPLEKPRGLTVKRVGDLFQPTRTDAIRSVLVFLDLLERYPNCVS